MGRGVVVMPAKGGWGGCGGGGSGSERSLLLFPPTLPFLFAVISAMAVVSVAVPLVEGLPTEERPPEGLGGCVYGGSEYEEGEIVATDEQCLNCTCSRGALICHLRACPPLPQTPGCKAVRRGSHACCPSIVCDDFDGTDRETVEDTTLRVNRTTSGCDEDGEHYEEGSYVPAKGGPCENCFCAERKVKCTLTPCPPAPIGCTALFGHRGECCPSRYDCSTAPSLTLPESENGIDFESAISPPTTEEVNSTNELEDYQGFKEEFSGSSYEQVTQIPKSTGGATFDGRKDRHMDESTTEDGVQEKTSSSPDEVEGNDGSEAIKEDSTEDTSERVEEESSATTTDQTTTETGDGALTSVTTTELSIENTKTEVIDETTTEEITTMSAETEESCSPGGEEGEGTTEGTTTEIMETTTTTTTLEAEESTTTEGLTDTQTTTQDESSNETTTFDPLTVKNTTESPSEEGGETTLIAMLEEDPSEGDSSSDSVSDKMNESIALEGNSSATVDTGEKEDLSQKSSHLVDIGAEGIDCEVQVNKSAGKEKEEESATMSSEKAANQSVAGGEAEVLKEEKANSTEGAMVETTPSSMESSITTVLSIDRKKDVDYDDYDYNEPTLPPSLPNLRIIPFVAADAVLDNDNHKTTENSIFFDGAPPSLFSPPVETEGGFVPREPPILHDVTYQSPVLSDVLPSHADIGLAGIAAIEITTTSKPNIQGNFGIQDNDVNETLASGILDPSVHMTEKDIYTHITDIRPLAVDSKLPPLLPIPLNFTLHNTSMSSTTKSENLKIMTATSIPAGSVPSIQMTSSTSSGFAASEIPRPQYSSDRVSEIPLGPTPPRPSPSTSPSYSVGPHITPEKTPSPSALSMGPSKPQNSPVVGLLKLAGCNIYGRMYRVGRIISELSGPCLECRCTEVGVQCRPLPC